MGNTDLIVKPVDETRGAPPPDTFVQDDTHLFCDVAPGEIVYFLALLRIRGSTDDADIRYTFRVPAGATLAYSPIGGLHSGPTAGVTQSNEHYNGTAIAAGLDPRPRQHCVMGVVQNGDEAGVIRLQWGQNTPILLPPRTITVAALSCLMVWRA